MRTKLLSIFRASGAPGMAANTRTVTVIAGLFVLAVQLTGCVLSIEPVIPESDALIDTTLYGTWELVGGSDRATLSADGQLAYSIAYTNSGTEALFGGRMGTLGVQRVLEVWPTPGETDVLEPYEGLLIRGHMIFNVDAGADELHLAPLDVDSLYKAIEVGELNLGYSGSEGQLVLFGTTSELRNALGQYVQRTSVFGERSVWRKIRGD